MGRISEKSGLKSTGFLQCSPDKVAGSRPFSRFFQLSKYFTVSRKQKFVEKKAAAPRTVEK